MVQGYLMPLLKSLLDVVFSFLPYFNLILGVVFFDLNFHLLVSILLDLI